MRRRTNRSNISRRKIRKPPSRKTRRKSRRTTKRSRVRSKGLRRKNIRHRGGAHGGPNPLAPITPSGIKAGSHGEFIKVHEDAQAQQIEMQAGNIREGEMLEDSGGGVFKYEPHSQTNDSGMEKKPNHWILRSGNGLSAIVSKDNSVIYNPKVGEFSAIGTPPWQEWELTNLYKIKIP